MSKGTVHSMAGLLAHSPLHDRHVARGAKFSEFGGWEMPLEYPDGVLKEHAAVREAVGLFDVSHLGKLQLRGVGAVEQANRVLTNDLGRISAGHAQYSMLCADDGGVVDDLIVYLRADDDVFIIPNASNSASVAATLSAGVGPDVTVADHHQDYAVIAVQGPRSIDVMDAAGLPTNLDYMGFADVEWRGHPVVVCRTGYTGEHGFEVLPRASDAAVLWDALVDEVARCSGLICGLAARDTLRTEMGYPLHGQDLSPEITPVQARLGWAVGWDKPEFVGREALVGERTSDPARRLWGLRSSDRGIPRPHMSVLTSADEVAGEVTSGTFSPTLRQGIGLALLATPLGEGDEVLVDVRGRKSVMNVVKPPFVDDHTRD